MGGPKPRSDDVERLSSDAPENARTGRDDAHADAATRLDIAPARLGSELAGDARPSEEAETSDAIKRTAENDGRI